MKLTVGVSGSALLVYEKKTLKKVMRQAGSEVAAVARSLIERGSGSGRVYIRKGRRYQASRPGAAPVKLSGNLRRGIKVSVFKSGEGVAVRDKEFYARFLEAGAKGGGKGKASRNKLGLRGLLTLSRSRTVTTTSRILLPRPFLTKALDMRRDSIAQRIRDAVERDVQFVRIKP